MMGNMSRKLQIWITIICLSMISDVLSCDGRIMIQASGISEFEKEKILDAHNRMRQSVALGQTGGQPPAANMMEMKWDPELANRAQFWATSCFSEKHDPSRHLRRFKVGQNIATTWTTKHPSSYHDMQSDFMDAIRKWFVESRYYTFGRVGPGSTGHYTQMIWSESNLIGCGYAFYYDPRKGFTKNYICNYGPAGNVLGSTPYQKGYPNCLSYGLSESRKYHGLCDKPSNYFYGISNYIG